MMSPRPAARSRFPLLLTSLALAVLGGCEHPDILVTVTRSDNSISFTLTACTPELTALRCTQDHEPVQALAANASDGEATIGIFRKDASPVIRLLLQQGAGAAPARQPPLCRLLDVKLGDGGQKIDVGVTVGHPMETSCTPMDRCTGGGSCVTQ